MRRRSTTPRRPARTCSTSRRARGRAASFLRAGDRSLYTAAHLGLRLLLGRYLDIDPAAVPLIRLECPTCDVLHGRPAVEGQPGHFSLSHSAGRGLLAFAAVPVGADVEAVRELKTVGEVVSALHAREAGERTATSPADRPRAFARPWAREEAHLKGLGTGLGRDPSLDHVGTGGSAASLPDWSISDVAVGTAHEAAVAVCSR
ncbi:4'-phosphopantetheinyl transferase family protein [Streptomyces sp. NPDC085540]|uniref:4'-phosphopantetheinyl transferase family protein n=1 Tax=Streptomyces sp. NPDC085540 TaxID=3365730 RepID=UPI0037D1BAA6